MTWPTAKSRALEEALLQLREKEALVEAIDGRAAGGPLLKLLSNSLNAYYQLRRSL